MKNNAELVRWTPEADQLAVEAAAICYNSKPEPAIIRYCIQSGHHSVLEHNAFTFKIRVARIISQMFTRHRIASFSQRSQRYCVEDAFKYYTPPEIKENQELNTRWTQLQKEIQEVYNYLLDAGLPAELARLSLTNATETVFYMTMNARELRHFFHLRLCHRAQREIREIAQTMLSQLKEVSPLLFGDIDLPCKMRGYCDQGKMSCGICPTLQEIMQAYHQEKNS